ncbi:MAG TPA: hypothetical protein PLM56_10105 [Cyclobacteriaceae bacterium]|jgi:hypothetical protein|nr:hypothetical protein [Cytophagales bacterium]HRE67876.1 hypothetical protein [Cyclobacteriaceae bacterium]HRF33842.1 hypothetical protein [Cyclobacteriaceae bacterium]
MNKAIIIIIFSASCLTTYSQKIAITYHDSTWQLTTKEFAQYYRTGIIGEDFRYYGEVTDYFMNGQPQMKGYFSANIKIDTFYFYYPNGKLMTKGLYKDNLRYGFWTSYYENGKIKDKVGFDGNFICALEYYDANGNALMEKGTGIWKTKYYYDLTSDIVEIEGSYKDTLRHGVWTSHKTSVMPWITHERKLECLEEYENGMFVRGKYYWGGGGVQDIGRPTMNILPETDKFNKLENWDFSKYASIEAYPFLEFLPNVDSTVFPVDKLAEFPGGIDSLTKIVRNNIKLSKSYIASQKLRSMLFEIRINAKGKLKITEYPSELILMSFPTNQLFYDKSLKTVKKLKGWIPATRGANRVVNYFMLAIHLDDGHISVQLISLNQAKGD